MRDAHRIKEKMEVSLDGRQIFFLLFGGALVACLVFVVGVMVGKRLEVRTARAAHAPADELARVDEESREIGAQLTFHDELVKPDLQMRVPQEVLEWRNMGEASQAVAASPALSAAGSISAAQVVAAGDAQGAPSGRAARFAGGAGHSAVVRGRRDMKVRRARAERRRFTLQVSAYKSRAEADQMVRKLQAEGYRPYVVAANLPRKGVWYRVRIGSFGSVAQAKAAKAKFERQVNLPAYVSRQ